MKSLISTAILLILSLSVSLILNGNNSGKAAEVSPERIVLYQLTGYGGPQCPNQEIHMEDLHLPDFKRPESAASDHVAFHEQLSGLGYDDANRKILSGYFRIEYSPCDILISAALENELR